MSISDAIIGVYSSGEKLNPQQELLYAKLIEALNPIIENIVKEWFGEKSNSGPDQWDNLSLQQRMNELVERIKERTGINENTVRIMINDINNWDYYSNIINTPGELQLGGRRKPQRKTNKRGRRRLRKSRKLRRK